MNKKVIFTIAPMALLMGVLTGCGNSSKEYTVKFDTDLGTTIADVKVKEGSTVTRPSTDPVKTGYTFIDWYIAKDSETKFDFDNTKIVKDTTIYAHYDVEPSIEFSISPKDPITVKKDEEKQLQINFSDPKGYDAMKDIKWTFDDKYIEKVDEAKDHMTFKIKGKEVTDEVGTMIGVTIISKSGISKEKSCQVHVEDATPAWQQYCQFDINGDNTVQVSVKNNIIRSTVVGALDLPSKVDGKFVIDGIPGTEYTVNKVTNFGFQECTALTSINIPGSVKEIDNEAFTGCSSLSTVTLNEGLERIQGSAFAAAKVTDFVIPSTVTELNGGALGHNDKHLTSLTFAGASKYWLIQPEETGYIEAYYPSTDLLTKFNQNITTYWEKCVIEFYKPAELIHLGRSSSGTVQISDGTIDWLYCSDQSVLQITGTAPNLSFQAQKTGEVTMTVKTTDNRYGYVAVTVDE